MNENEFLVKELVKLNILYIRWIERHTNYRYVTHRDLEKPLFKGTRTATYGEATENLKNDILKKCENEYIRNSILKLEESIKNSQISNLRFGVEPKKRFSKLEQELDSFSMKRMFFMITSMAGIKYVAADLGLTESAIKQACQQERLLNTTKVGNNWMVHIPECRLYWNIPDEDEAHLYKDWEY